MRVALDPGRLLRGIVPSLSTGRDAPTQKYSHRSSPTKLLPRHPKGRQAGCRGVGIARTDDSPCWAIQYPGSPNPRRGNTSRCLRIHARAECGIVWCRSCLCLHTDGRGPSPGRRGRRSCGRPMVSFRSGAAASEDSSVRGRRPPIGRRGPNKCSAASCRTYRTSESGGRRDSDARPETSTPPSYRPIRVPGLART
jgi:hypothetical protein